MRARLPWAPFLLASCISSNPPAPPVRWFDPTPSDPPPFERPGAQLPSVNVTAAPTVRQDFVLRVGARELAIDELHRWSATPDRLVQQALDRALFGPGAGVPGSGPGSGTVNVRVARFEVDLSSGAPHARVELQVATAKGLQTCDGDATASATAPELIAAAMAQALGQAVLAARAVLAAP
jgi:ABC-type uncharacterized transport system auxiliary subunit